MTSTRSIGILGSLIESVTPPGATSPAQARAQHSSNTTKRRPVGPCRDRAFANAMPTAIAPQIATTTGHLVFLGMALNRQPTMTRIAALARQIGSA